MPLPWQDSIKQWDVAHNFFCHPKCPKGPRHPTWERYVRFRGHRKEPMDPESMGIQHLRGSGWWDPGLNAADAAVWHIGRGILFGNYYSMVFVQDEDLYRQLRWTVRACVRFRDEFHAKAAEVVARLGGVGGFNAVHLRRDDWYNLPANEDSIRFDPEGMAEP